MNIIHLSEKDIEQINNLYKAIKYKLKPVFNSSINGMITFLNNRTGFTENNLESTVEMLYELNEKGKGNLSLESIKILKEIRKIYKKYSFKVN